MGYDLSTPVLRFKSAKTYLIVLYSMMIIIMCAPAALTIYDVGQGTVSLINPTNFLPLFLILIMLWAVFKAATSNDTMLIDEVGVQINMRGVKRAYAWNDIGQVRQVALGGRAGYAVQIVRKGELPIDDTSNVILGGFPICSDDLAKLLRERKAQWDERKC